MPLSFLHFQQSSLPRPFLCLTLFIYGIPCLILACCLLQNIFSLLQSSLFFSMFHRLRLYIQSFPASNAVHIFHRLILRVRLLSEMKVLFFSGWNPVGVQINYLKPLHSKNKKRSFNPGDPLGSHMTPTVLDFTKKPENASIRRFERRSNLYLCIDI